MKEDENERIINLIGRIFGDDVAKVLGVLLNENKEMRDDDIARELGMRVNSVRKALYRLHANQIVVYRKIYDTTSRWYIYLWHTNEEGLKNLIRKRMKLVINILKERLEYEKNNTFFKCKSGSCPRITFEEALENSFRCPYCGGELEQDDNSRIIKALEEKINKLTRELII